MLHTIPEVLMDYSSRARAELGGRCRAVVLYGSYARGQATADSDIDVLVVVEDQARLTEEWNKCIEIAADICSHTGELIGVVAATEEEYLHRNHPLLISVRREGIVLP